jgi:hypothetical protein
VENGYFALEILWIKFLCCVFAEPRFRRLLPMLRRAFSEIDRLERRRLLDLLGKPLKAASSGAAMQDGTSAPAFEGALLLLLSILGIEQKELQP